MLARPARSAATASRSGRATTDAASRPRAARRGGARPCGCAGRGSGRRRPARVPSTRTVWANSRSGTVACSAGAASARCSSSGNGLPAMRESTSALEPGPRAPAAASRKRLLVRRRAAGQRADANRAPCPSAAAAADSARSHEAGRSCVAVAHERLHDPLLGVDRLVGEAALVAQPAVVDLLVVAREHAQHALVAHRQLDVALRRAQRADRARALDVPRPRAEAVRRATSARRPGTAR